MVGFVMVIFVQFVFILFIKAAKRVHLPILELTTSVPGKTESDVIHFS